MRQIVLAENLSALPGLASAFARLIYIDPPFNTGRRQAPKRIRAQASPEGGRVGFAGRRYRVTPVSSSAYADRFDLG